MKRELKQAILDELVKLGCKNERLIREMKVELKYADLPGMCICEEDLNDHGYTSDGDIEVLEDLASAMSNSLTDSGEWSNLICDACNVNDIKPLEEE